MKTAILTIVIGLGLASSALAQGNGNCLGTRCGFYVQTPNGTRIVDAPNPNGRRLFRPRPAARTNPVQPVVPPVHLRPIRRSDRTTTTTTTIRATRTNRIGSWRAASSANATRTRSAGSRPRAGTPQRLGAETFLNKLGARK